MSELTKYTLALCANWLVKLTPVQRKKNHRRRQKICQLLHISTGFFELRSFMDYMKLAKSAHGLSLHSEEGIEKRDIFFSPSKVINVILCGVKKDGIEAV